MANNKRVRAACEHYDMSRNTLMKYAEAAGAVSWLGRLVYINCDVMDEYIREHLGNRPPKRKEGKGA